MAGPRSRVRAPEGKLLCRPRINTFPECGGGSPGQARADEHFLWNLIQPPQSVTDGEIDLTRIGAQQGGGEEPVAVALARFRQQRLEFLQVDIRRLAEAPVVAVQRGDAIDRFGPDRLRQPPREGAAVA